MIFSYRKIIVPLVFLFLSGGFASAKVLTLDDCIQLALKRHPDAIGARNQVKVADGYVWQSFGAFLPSLSTGASWSQANRQASDYYMDSILIHDDGITKAYSIGASADITIFNGGQNIFNYLGAKADRNYYRYIAEQTEQSLILSVKTAYYAYLATLRLKTANEEAVKSGEEQYKLASSKYEIGSASKSDVLKAQVQYSRDKLALITAENGVQTGRANLAYLIGVDVNSDVEFSADLKKKEYDGNEEMALKFGMSHYPGLLASEMNLAVAKYSLRSTRGRYFPSLSVSLSKDWSNSIWKSVKDFRNEDAQWRISTSLNFPIFENFSRKAAMSRAKADLSNARAGYNYAQNSVALEIRKAFLEMTKGRETLKLEEENEAAAKEDMALVQEKYSLGAAAMLELLDAQVSLITAQNSKIQAEFDYNLAVAKLENAMGLK